MRNKLISAVLATLVACVTLPALSQDAPEKVAAPEAVAAPVQAPAPVAIARPEVKPEKEVGAFADTLPPKGSDQIAQTDMPQTPTPSDPAPGGDQSMNRELYPAQTTTPLAPIPNAGTDTSDYRKEAQQSITTQPQAVDATPDKSEGDNTPAPANNENNASNNKVEENAAPQISVNVSNLKAYSLESDYMSLPGTLRYKNFLATGEWISRDQAIAAVNTQLSAANR